MPWVWIDGKTDTDLDKLQMWMITNIIANVEAGYVGNTQDFYDLVSLFKRIFTVQKIIDDITAPHVKP